MQPLLQVDDLTVGYCPHDREQPVALEGLTFEIAAGEAVGLLGESGCGKTTLGLALLGLLPPAGRIMRGSVVFRGDNLLTLPEHELQKVRGAGISMIYQEPGAALNPVLGVGEQVTEVIRAHQPMSRERAREEGAFLFAQVGLPKQTCIAAAYPHQLSGGQQQRVAIAQAIACHPALLIADEPTTALDRVTQLEIVDLLTSLREKLQLALLLITHDSGVLTRAVDRIMVMREGRIVEQGPTREVVHKSLGGYTRALLNSPPMDTQRKKRRPSIAPIPDEAAGFPTSCGPHLLNETSPPDLSTFADVASQTTAGRETHGEVDSLTRRGDSQPSTQGETLVCAVNLQKRYLQGRWLSRRRHPVEALCGVDLTLRQGSTLALIGASGSGKSTLARCLACLEIPDSGEIWFGGTNLAALTHRQLISFRRQIQLIFQDPGSSLNPAFMAVEIVAEPLLTVRPGTKKESRDRALALMELVGLRADWGERLPHQFSAGQRRRLAIARALSLEPRLLILDEALAGLDLPIQAQIANLLLDLQATLSLTYLYISHDLGLVADLADQVAVLHRGQIVESAIPPELLAKPQSVQAANLVSAALELEGFRG